MTGKQRWVMGLTAIASLMVALDVTVVATALSSIHLHLKASVTELEWTVNAYALSFAVLLMSGSALGDRFGRRRLLAAGLGLFAAASAACALAPNVGLLIAARAVQGAGAAVIAPVSLTLLTVAFPPERRGAALGIFGGITGLAVLGGPVVGGAVTQGMAWQWIFWLNVPIGLLAIPFVLSRIEESRGPRVALDAPGLLLVTGAGLGLVWGLVRGNSAGWGSVEVVGTLAAGVLLTLAFVAWERRAKAPMLPLRLFRERAFSLGNATTLLMYGALFNAVFFIPQFLQTALGHGPLGAGLRLLPWTGVVFMIAPLSGALSDRIGSRSLIVSGLLIQGAGMLWIALIASSTLPYSHLIAPMIMAGTGISLAIPPAQKVIVSSVAGADVGKASGTFTMTRQLGGAFALAVGVAVFTGSGSYLSPHAFTDGFVAAIAVSAVCSFGGAVTGALLKPRPSRALGAVPVAVVEG
jgi:EmrB/QacA subfamily drug resistance transporter